MRVINILLIAVVISWASACSSNDRGLGWYWTSDISLLVEKENDKISQYELGSYWNNVYRKSVFSVSNSISKGWRDEGFQPDIYSKVLTGFWVNDEGIRILEDPLIKLSVLKWVFNLKNRCFHPSIDIDVAREYVIGYLDNSEQILVNSSISTLGVIGDPRDVSRLIELMLENQGDHIGNSAFTALVLMGGDALKALRKATNQIVEKDLRDKIEAELAVNRVADFEKCHEKDRIQIK